MEESRDRVETKRLRDQKEAGKINQLRHVFILLLCSNILFF